MSEPPVSPTEWLRLDQLRLDPDNPRLPEDLGDMTQDNLRKYIANAYEAIEVGKSIADHGYFASEPLIAIPNNDSTYTVVEGNRRLTALQILNNPTLSEGLDDEGEWIELDLSEPLPTEFPVVVMPDRESVAPIIGYRHISGIEPWDPFAKARFLAQNINSGKSISSVAREVGERSTEVASSYRNLRILKQARDDFHIDTKRAEDRFGVFTRAMNSQPLRSFIGAPAPSEVSPSEEPVIPENSEKVRELLSWLFGDADQSKIIGESRDITELGTAVESPIGLSVLRETRDLNEAYIAAGGLRERLLDRLSQARGRLAASQLDIQEYSEDEAVRTLLSEIRTELERLEAVRPNG